MIIVLMGVSGSGKTRVGKLLAANLGWIFIDADDHHPGANVDKMAAGLPLDDDDRAPWLESLRRTLRAIDERDGNAVLACSALKRHFRERLAEGLGRIEIVVLRGRTATIARRLRARKGHFFSASLLESQFAALEEPEGALVVDVESTPGRIVRRIERALLGDDSSRARNARRGRPSR